MYITHLRSEGATFLEALDELLTIMRATGVTGEIYHLKAAGDYELAQDGRSNRPGSKRRGLKVCP